MTRSPIAEGSGRGLFPAGPGPSLRACCLEVGPAGRAERQVEMIVENRRAFGHYHHGQHDVARIYALLGEVDLALEWLGETARNSFPCYGFFRVDPLLASLRGDDRFQSLMDELEVECNGYRELYDALR